MTPIVIEIPENLKDLVSPLRALIDTVERQAGRSRGQRPEYARFERELADVTSAVERAGHQVALASLDIDSDKVMIDGELFAKVGRHRLEYKSRVGAVPVLRSIYRRVGERNGKTVDTVSLRAGAIEDGWLPGTARAVAALTARGTSREGEVTARRLGVLPYSRSSFERIGHAVGDELVSRHHEIEEILIQDAKVHPEAASVSVSLDRVSLPMEEPRPRPVGRPRKGAPKRPISRVYRMAYCGTVTTHDAEGNALETIRYGTMPGNDPTMLCMGLAGDVLALRDKQPGLAVVLLADGAPELWNLLGDELDDAGAFGEITRLIDFWHVIEKLSAAAAVIFGPDDQAEAVRRWKLDLLNHSRSATRILEELEDSGKEDVRRGDTRPVHDAITYLRNNGDRMNYAAARRAGLPIGSGCIEATCKSLVALRMKRPGARWKPETGEHILQLRALDLSDRWESAMDILFKRPPPRIRAVG